MAEVGYDNIKIGFDLVIESANVMDKIRQGEGSAKFMPLLDLIDEVSKIPDFDYSMFKLEWKNLNADEREALIEHGKKKFELSNKAVEAKIEAASEISVSLIALIPQAIRLVQDLKEVVKKKPKVSKKTSKKK